VLYPDIPVQFDCPQVIIDLNIYQNYGNDKLNDKTRPNLFYKVKNLDEGPLLESAKICSVQSAIVRYVFSDLFSIELNEEESDVLSHYSEVSIACILFLHYLRLTNVEYFDQNHLERMQFYYKGFISIVETRNKYHVYRIEKPRTIIPIVKQYQVLVKALIYERKLTLDNIFQLKGFISDEFPVIELRKLEIDKLKFEKEKLEKKFQVELLRLKFKKDDIDFRIYRVMVIGLARIANQYQNLSKELLSDIYEEKYYEAIMCLFSKYLSNIQNNH
jgi:hypothetical protein